MTLLKEIKKYFFNKRIEKYLKTTKDDINFIVNLYAVIVYLDKQVKQIEILNSFNLLDGYIRLKFKKLDEDKIKDIETYAKELFYQKLHEFKAIEGSFELLKQEILSTLRKIKNKKLYRNILIIINSDNIVTDKENQFIVEMQKIYNEG